MNVIAEAVCSTTATLDRETVGRDGRGASGVLQRELRGVKPGDPDAQDRRGGTGVCHDRDLTGGSRRRRITSRGIED